MSSSIGSTRVKNTLRCHYQIWLVHILDGIVGKRCVLRHFSKWILIPTDEHAQSKAIFTTNITIDNMNIIIMNSSEEVSVLSLYWGHSGRDWRVLNHNFSSLESVFPNTRYAMNGRTLLVASLEYLPYAKKNIVDGQLFYSGVSLEILTRLTEVFNFTVTFVEPEDQLWGYRVNSTWNGIVGMIHRGEADMCGVPYAMNIERSKIMTFSYPINYEYHSAVYKKSEDESQHWSVLLSCFKWEVYMCGLFALFIVMALFAFLERVDPSKKSENSSQLGHNLVVVLQTVAVPLHQGTMTLSTSASFRVLLSFWWLFCIVITSVYTGNLIAFLTVSKEHIPFRTLEDVGQQDEYKVGVSSGSYLELVLKDSNDSTLQNVWKRILPPSGSANIDEEFQSTIEELYKGNYVFITSQLAIDVLMADTCRLSKLLESFMPIYSSFTFPKLSPLSELFAGELMDMTEKGLIDTWFRIWSPKAKICLENSQSEKLQLKLKDLYSALVACASGICIAGVVLLCEKITGLSRHGLLNH